MAMITRLLCLIHLVSSVAVAQIPADLQEAIERIRQQPRIDRPIPRDLQETIRRYEEILKGEPNDAVALRELCQIYRDAGHLLKAREYALRSAQIEPFSLGVSYMVGALDWLIVYDKRMLQSTEERDRLILEGMQHLDIALAIDRDFNDAMMYKSLLLREKAKIASDQAEKNSLIAEANQWFQRAIETRRNNLSTR